MMWNYALDDKGGPLFPGTNSCGGGCRGVATISKDKFTLNEECKGTLGCLDPRSYSYLCSSLCHGTCFSRSDPATKRWPVCKTD